MDKNNFHFYIYRRINTVQYTVCTSKFIFTKREKHTYPKVMQKSTPESKTKLFHKDKEK